MIIMLKDYTKLQQRICMQTVDIFI